MFSSPIEKLLCWRYENGQSIWLSKAYGTVEQIISSCHTQSNAECLSIAWKEVNASNSTATRSVFSHSGQNEQTSHPHKHQSHFTYVIKQPRNGLLMDFGQGFKGYTIIFVLNVLWM